MTLRFVIKAVLTAILVMIQVASIAAKSGSTTQKTTIQSHPVISQETYNRVLDIVFPRDDPDPSKTIFAFVLRFKPHSQPESQIVIRRGVEKVEVVEYTSLDGDIYIKLNKTLERTGKEDPVEMAKGIRVKRREVRITHAQITEWYAAFFDSLASAAKPLKEKGEEFDKTGGSETVFLHGGFYDLWYGQRLTQISFGLYDVDVDDQRSTGELKLVQWMNSIRREVTKSK